jgi:hypothetical protein
MFEQIINWFFGILIQPVKTLKDIARERPANEAFLIYLCITTLNLLASLYNRQSLQALEDLMKETNIHLPLSVIVAASILMAIISIFIITGLLHLLVRLFKGSGAYWSFFSAYALANFPLIIGVPITFASGFMEAGWNALAGAVSFGISLWIMILQIIAIRESYGLSTAGSVGIYFLHLVVLIGVPVIIVLVIAFSLAFV